MIYGSVCSGIEAASVAWHPLGMRPAWFAEIDPFPSAVLAARWPDVRNLGDFTAIGAEHGPVDVLVGGTPCQSFSVAGGRAGLDDPRGVLALEFLRLALRVRARWLVWENVPGALSSGNGRDLRDILGAFVDAGYGVAWRVLDAQWFGVPQRRRRLFAVGYLGDWRPAAAVLLERPSVHGNSAKSGSAGAGASEGSRSGIEGVVGTLTATAGKSTSSADIANNVIGTLLGHHHRNAPDDPIVVVPDVAARGCDDQENLVAVPIQDATRNPNQHGSGIGNRGDPSFTLTTRSTHAIAFHASQDPISSSSSPCLGSRDTMGILTFDDVQITHRENRTNPIPDGAAPTLAARSGGRVTAISTAMRPRRLTPREWERLQGFPDDYTAILIGKSSKPAKDGPRYEALGNSMAVPVMRWIGRRLQFVDSIARPPTTED